MKDNLVGIKFEKKELTIIDEAAEVDRRPRSQFIAKAALDKAMEILPNDRPRDFQQV